MPYTTGNILLDKYRIEEQIGKGAFGEVYRVTHLKLNMPRALKVLGRDAPGLGSTEYGEYQDRFKLEAQLGAKLNHPNIIQVHDFEMDGEDLFLVMEYAAGGNLSKRIEQAKQGGTPMPLGTALAIAQEVAEGLAKLHELDVVHRDLKPSNILFDEKGHAKVADFGLAQTPGGPSMRSQLSDPAPHPGTPAYMSPEQKNSRDYLTPTSDVYALGLVLFEMLTGRVYRSQRPGTRAAGLREDVPAWLDDLLASMLSETPENRPWDGKEVLAKLRAGAQVEDEKQKAGRIQKEADERVRQTALDKAEQEQADRKQREAEQRAAEIARLRGAVQVAIQRGDWNRAKQTMGELGKYGKEGQAEAGKFQERLIQAQQEAERKEVKRPTGNRGHFPTWMVAVITILLLGLAAIGISSLLSNLVKADVPLATIPPTYIFIPTGTANVPTEIIPVTKIPEIMFTPTITVTVSAQITPGVGTPLGICNDAVYISDVTIPDGMQMTPGQEFIKTWKIKNTGTCLWGAGYTVVFSYGEKMSGLPTSLITAVTPGSEVDVSVRFKAPTKAGEYISAWRMADAKGSGFGMFFFVKIIVR